MGYLSKGATYREIAQRLNISVRGVENHLDRMRNNNRLQTVDELVVLYADWEHGQRENK
ncbi:MAG: winged helix-turn-helix transcriptional regulator [Desulfovibrio sp.]|nr:winged helix-turn-helix transcriptional regulator [Desulfovibrio sp.]